MFKRRTPSIEIENSISELKKVKIGGWDQWLLIRGENVNNPVLLLLHGGPGTAQIGFNRYYQQELEKHFIVVNWDQRGAGLSFSKNIPVESMNISQFLEDLIEVTQYLKSEYRQEKIFLVGHSWGSLLGMLAIKEHPEHYFHYFGVSQVVNMRRAEEVSYDLLIEKVKESNNLKALQDLIKIGKPPWSHLKEDRIHQKYLDAFGGGISHDGKLINQFLLKLIKSSEYTFLDVIKHLQGQVFSMKTMITELRDFEMEKMIDKVEVPVTFIAGKYDLQVPSQPTKEFFDKLVAPKKEWMIFEESAHSPNYEEIENFTKVILERSVHYEK